MKGLCIAPRKESHFVTETANYRALFPGHKSCFRAPKRLYKLVRHPSTRHQTNSIHFSQSTQPNCTLHNSSNVSQTIPRKLHLRRSQIRSRSRHVHRIRSMQLHLLLEESLMAYASQARRLQTSHESRRDYRLRLQVRCASSEVLQDLWRPSVRYTQ